MTVVLVFKSITFSLKKAGEFSLDILELNCLLAALLAVLLLELFIFSLLPLELGPDPVAVASPCPWPSGLPSDPTLFSLKKGCLETKYDIIR